MVAPGDHLMGRYEVQRVIASGGMADVYLAHDVRLDRSVAIKSFRIGAADPRRFESEIRLLARLNHPNLVSVFDAGEDDDAPFVVLQYVDGPTLAQKLASGPMAPAEVRRLGADIASALEHVHRNRIVHRDLKPSNILLDDGRALLGDFGVAVLLDATRLTIDAGTVGTAAYLAPEQATGSDVTAAADVYSLGLVLLEALTGRAAYAGSLQEVVTAKLSRDPDVPGDLPAPWPGLLTAMTRRPPDQRPTAAAVRTTLGAPASVGDDATATMVMPAAAAAAVPVGDRTPAVARSWRKPLAVAAAAVVLLSGLALLLIAARGGEVPASPTSPTSPTSTTTSTPSTSSTSSSTTSTTSLAMQCALLEEQRVELERQRELIDDDDDDNEGRGSGRGNDKQEEQEKKALEAQRDAIKKEMEELGCLD